MDVELPSQLEAALKAQANARGVSPAGYVCELLQRELAPSIEKQATGTPFKTGRGTIELAYALVAYLVCRARSIHPVHKHALPRGLQPKLFLILQRAHRCQLVKLMVKR